MSNVRRHEQPPQHARARYLLPRHVLRSHDHCPDRMASNAEGEKSVSLLEEHRLVCAPDTCRLCAWRAHRRLRSTEFQSSAARSHWSNRRTELDSGRAPVFSRRNLDRRRKLAVVSAHQTRRSALVVSDEPPATAVPRLHKQRMDGAWCSRRSRLVARCSRYQPWPTSVTPCIFPKTLPEGLLSIQLGKRVGGQRAALSTDEPAENRVAVGAPNPIGL